MFDINASAGKDRAAVPVLPSGPMSNVHPERQPDGERLRALVAEDEPTIRALVTAVLNHQGFHVDGACNGREALEFLERHDYRVVILDLAMPEMTGDQVIDHLRERDPGRLRRVVVVTAALHRLRQRFPEGVCKVLTKPFDLEVFKAAVADCSAAAD